MKMQTVHIQADGPTGAGTRITTEDGTPVLGVRHAVVEIPVHGPITATLEILSATVGTTAVPIFKVMDPNLGELKAVHRIGFADGSVFEAGVLSQGRDDSDPPHRVYGWECAGKGSAAD